MKVFRSTFLFLFTLISFSVLAQPTAKISQQQLLALMSTPAAEMIVLDVRSPAEFAQGHIEGAINISHDEINENLSKISGYKNHTVVVHCRSGRRAISAEAALSAAGFTQLRHLEGDMNAWQAAKLPLVQEK